MVFMHRHLWGPPAGGISHQQQHVPVAVRSTRHGRRLRTQLHAAQSVHPGDAEGQGGTPHTEELQQRRAEQLKAWVVQHTPSSRLPTDLVPKPDHNTGGFSMITLEPVQRGQVLVRVPRQLMITAATAAADKEYGQLVTDGPLTEWQALVLALLCERARGSSSFWAPYIVQLPDQADHPLAWGPERSSWLQGSPMHSTLLARQQQVRDDCEVLQLVGANQLPLAQAWAQAHQGEELVTVHSVTWAAATLLSRAFSIDMTDDEALEGDLSYFGSWSAVAPGSNAGAGDVLAVVPWADTLSHCSQAGPESCLRYCCELQVRVQAASLCAHQSHAPGEDVFDSYGPGLCPADLLLDYGFVDPTNTNHRVEVDPQRMVEPSGKCAKALLSALEQAHTGGVATPGQEEGVQGGGVRLPVTCDGPDATLLAWLRAALSSDAELIRAGWRVKAGPGDVELACRVMGRLTQPSSAAMEERVLQVVKAHLDSRLTAYPSTREQDLQDAAEASTSGPRHEVLMALASEKQALQEAIHVVAGWQARLQQGCPLEELYAVEGADEDGDDEFFEEEGEDDSDGWGR